MKDVITVTPDTLLGEIARMKQQGQRLITLTCVDLGETGFDILYHFDEDLKLTDYRMTIPNDFSPPSISGIYFCAFLVENEIFDLFGVKFDGLVLDFGGTLFLDDEVTRTPLCRYSVAKKDSAEA